MFLVTGPVTKEGVGVARRGDEPHAISLRVVDRCEGGRDFELATVARAGVRRGAPAVTVKANGRVLQSRRLAQSLATCG